MKIKYSDVGGLLCILDLLSDRNGHAGLAQ